LPLQKNMAAMRAKKPLTEDGRVGGPPAGRFQRDVVAASRKRILKIQGNRAGQKRYFSRTSFVLFSQWSANYGIPPPPPMQLPSLYFSHLAGKHAKKVWFHYDFLPLKSQKMPLDF
jgi:hypothetical protein